MPKTIVYIDGFNFYYGLLRNPKYKGYKWLDQFQFWQKIRQNDVIESVKYFTAYWHDDSGDRHRAYTSALSAYRPEVEVITGNYKKRTRQCKSGLCTYTGNKKFTTYEEKHTDVNIALHMLDDAYMQRCDLMTIVTGDSDLVPALALVRTRFPHIKLAIYIPGPHERFTQALDIRNMADVAKSVPGNLLKHCQLPTKVTAGPASFEKPKSW